MSLSSSTVSHKMEEMINVVSPLNFCLNSFEAHDLDAQERASLLDRIDNKFVINIHDLPAILLAIKNSYSILSINDENLFDYETVYYDTQAFDLYHMHHAGKKNRFKIRTRRYLQTNKTYHEIKIKDNKGLTKKVRQEQLANSTTSTFNKSLLKDTLNIDADSFNKKVRVKYKRFTLLNKLSNQRVTVDINIQFENMDTHYLKQMNNIAIIEIKRERSDHQLKQSCLHSVLKKMAYRETTFSKYCMGCLLTKIKGIKYNHFKTNLLDLSHASYH